MGVEWQLNQTKSKKGNYKAALLTIAKYAIGLANKDAATAFDTLLKAVGALNETHPTIEQRVWDWWRETAAVALAEAIRTPRALSPLTGKEVEKAVANFLERNPISLDRILRR